MTRQDEKLLWCILEATTKLIRELWKMRGR